MQKSHIDGMSFLDLFLQSETLWFLPPFDASLANPRECQLPRYLAFGSHDNAVPPHQSQMGGGGMGAFLLDQTVVLVPKAHILTEAAIRIMARDYYKECHSHSQSLVEYVSIYIDPLGYLDPNLLPEPFDRIYTERKPGKTPEFYTRLLRSCGTPLWNPEMYR
jgi:hypothetical protein